MHRVPLQLIERQAESLGLPLTIVQVPTMPSNDSYEERMAAAMMAARNDGVRTVAFGDLFLEDIREYREGMLATVGMEALFPLWGLNTADLARRFIEDGFRATIACVDGDQLSERFTGREFDEAFLADLPDGVDPCGENGEFHTFVYDGPGFREPVPFERGEHYVVDGRFHYRELHPS